MTTIAWRKKTPRKRITTKNNSRSRGFREPICNTRGYGVGLG